MRALPILAALVALALTAPQAFAQATGDPFAPLPPAPATPTPEPEPTPAPTTSSNPNDEQVSTLGVFGLFVGGVLVIVLIGMFIMRDARRSIPKSKRKKRKTGAAPPPKPSASGKRPPPRRPSASARKRRTKRQKRRAR